MSKKYHCVELPSNYAWQLLQSEIELELGEKLTIGLVQRLLELYALGVEYYESLRSYKYLFFQRKMNNLMVSQKVMQTMSAPPTTPQSPNTNNPSSAPKPSQDPQHHHKVLLAKTRQDQLQKQLLYSNTQVSAAKVKTIIQNTQQQANSLQVKIQSELSKQHNSILEKVEKRKRNAFLRKSQSVADMTRHSSSNQLLDSSVDGEKERRNEVKLEKIRVDFSSIINENQEEEDKPPSVRKSRELKKKVVVQEVAENQTKPENKVQTKPKDNHLRKRNKTLIKAKIKQQPKDKHETHSQGLPQIQEIDDLLI